MWLLGLDHGIGLSRVPFKKSQVLIQYKHMSTAWTPLTPCFRIGYLLAFGADTAGHCCSHLALSVRVTPAAAGVLGRRADRCWCRLLVLRVWTPAWQHWCPRETGNDGAAEERPWTVAWGAREACSWPEPSVVYLGSLTQEC